MHLSAAYGQHRAIFQAYPKRPIFLQAFGGPQLSGAQHFDLAAARNIVGLPASEQIVLSAAGQRLNLFDDAGACGGCDHLQGEFLAGLDQHGGGNGSELLWELVFAYVEVDADARDGPSEAEAGLDSLTEDAADFLSID